VNLVREYINEKFTDESDPIQDMGIGAINNFKNLIALFDKQDNKKLIFSVHNRSSFIDFWFNSPNIKKLSDKEVSGLFDYIKNIIYNLGLRYILTDPKLFMHDIPDEIRDMIFPMVIRFKIKPQFRHILKFKKCDRGLSNLNLEPTFGAESLRSKEDYEVNFKKLKSRS
jgi:hypothetical protein